MKKHIMQEYLQNPALWATFVLCVAIATLFGAITSIYARFITPFSRISAFICLSVLLIVSVFFLLQLLHMRIHGAKIGLCTIGFGFLAAGCEIIFSFLLAMLIAFILTTLQIPILTNPTFGLETIIGMVKSLLLYPLAFCALFAVIIEKIVNKAYWVTLLHLILKRYFILLLASIVCVALSALGGILASSLFAKILSILLTSALLSFSIERCMPQKQKDMT